MTYKGRFADSLVVAIFAMLKRQIEKHTFLRRHADVEALREGGSGKSSRDGVGCKRTWTSAEQVPRELIQHYDGSQQRTWRADAESLACHDQFVQGQEAIADLRISLIAA